MIFISRTRNFFLPKTTQLNTHKFSKLYVSKSVPDLDQHVAYFESVLGKSNLLTSASELLSYNTDWMNKYVGSSKLVLFPNSVEHVQLILQHCYKNNLKISVQGGNTSLVGGSVPIKDEIILNMKKFNKIIEFNQNEHYLICEAGCVLQSLNDYLNSNCDQIMPIDLGAKGSCFIGGNVATNAGGLRYIRYGSLKQNVLGLEVVVPNEKADVLNLLKTVRKDNTGVDLKQLFIGSEGTLGIITKVAIQTVQKPLSVNLALFGLNDFEQVKHAYVKSRHMLGEIVSECTKLVTKAFQSKCMLDEYPFYMLLETHGSNLEHDQSKLEKLIAYLIEHNIVEDGVLAQDGKQIDAIWQLRENIPSATSVLGKTYKYDVSLSLKYYYKCVEDMRRQLNKAGSDIVSVCGYGHIGDQNLHLNIVTKAYTNEIQNIIEPYIFEYISQHNGSISAEHGLGIHKAKYIEYSKQKEAIEYMRQIRKIFDPKAILNPGKMII